MVCDVAAIGFYLVQMLVAVEYSASSDGTEPL